MQLMVEAAARRGEEGTVLSHEPTDCGALLAHLSQSCCKRQFESHGCRNWSIWELWFCRSDYWRITWGMLCVCTSSSMVFSFWVFDKVMGDKLV